MGEKSALVVREYVAAGDAAVVDGWYAERGRWAPPVAILPKLGIMVATHDGRDLAALWLYMDNSVGVCFPEHICTAPGLGLAEAREALLCGLGFLRERAAAMDYGLLWIHTRPGIARCLERAGMARPVNRRMVAMMGMTRDGEEQASAPHRYE